ncbi:MAG TPA: DNA gyrase inhibitor YacG [Vicinamibacterales bacterium]|nr:DNA gyrase inhibitor YacG [Vicinamibacterales bacterium]
MGDADPRCVYCRTRPIDPAWRPFCSERCKWLDLARWIGGEYRIPAEPAPDPEGGDEPSREP